MKNRLPFVLIVTALMLVINVVIYEALSLSLLITSNTELLLIGITSFILSLSFFPAYLLALRKNTFFTRWLYRISSVWLAFLMYSFAFAFIYILFVAFITPSPALAEVLIVLTVVLTVYAVLHAWDIKVKRLEIKLENLPAHWKGRKIAFITDIHLGQIYGRERAANICAKITKENTDTVFIGGDLYDGVHVDAKAIIEPFSKLSTKLGTYFIMGNHEEFSSNAEYLAAVKDAGMHVLLDEMTIVDGLQLIGVDYQTTNTTEKYQKVLDTISIDPKNASILLKHVPTHIEMGEKKGFSLQLGGHTHKGQTFPVTLLVHAMFKEYYYGLKKYKNMSVYTSSGVGTTGAPLRFGSNAEIVILTLV